jgi:hypothetical protein
VASAAAPVRRKTPPRPAKVEVAPAPPAPAPPPPPPVVIPRKPDSLTIEVIRGDKVSQQKFEKPDSTIKKPPVR